MNVQAIWTIFWIFSLSPFKQKGNNATNIRNILISRNSNKSMKINIKSKSPPKGSTWHGQLSVIYVKQNFWYASRLDNNISLDKQSNYLAHSQLGCILPLMSLAYLRRKAYGCSIIKSNLIVWRRIRSRVMTSSYEMHHHHHHHHRHHQFNIT